MAVKDSAAFGKEQSAEKLKDTSDQYQQRTGQDDVPEGGPDPIIEAVQKQADEAAKDRDDEDVEEPALINPDYEKAHAEQTAELESKSEDEAKAEKKS
jgi:hypothetical protein